jgi:hypothetical protein
MFYAGQAAGSIRRPRTRVPVLAGSQAFEGLVQAEANVAGAG